MKKMKRCILVLVLLSMASCAWVTSHDVDVQRDAFLAKFPEVNNIILGDLKYDDPNLNLRTLGIKDYLGLVSREDLSEDEKKAVDYAFDGTPEKKFVVKRDTFYICIRSEKHNFIICDDAKTPGIDKVQVGTPIPTLEDFCSAFLGNAGKEEK